MDKKMKSTIDLICGLCDKVDLGGEASNRYRTILSKMTPAEFEEFMLSLKNGEDVLYVNIPNLQKKNVTFENNIKVAKSLGVDFFKRLSIVDQHTGKRFLTPLKYAIFHLPLRRQIQTIGSGISVATDESKIDPTTGQVVGDSQAASVSTPETFILYSKGLQKSIVELTKVRGGDTEAMRYAYNNLNTTGSCSIEEVMQLNTRATSTVTLNNMLTAMHIDNNI